MKVITWRLLCMMLLLLAISCQKQSPENRDKYVVLSPETAEIIAALGSAEDVIGITRECDYPETLKGKELVGDFGAINMEKVISLAPKIVFTSGLEQEAISLDLQKLGIEVYRSYPRTVAEMLQEILHIGRLIGKESEAEDLKQELESSITTIKNSAAGKSRPGVYLEIYRDPLMSVADNSFVGELIELSGGNNVFDRLERDYARVKAEAVIRAAPDMMICYSRDTKDNIVTRKGWDRIPAIKNRHIYFEEDIHPDLIQRAGPRCVEGMRALAALYEEWRADTQ
ncbi:MAG TPA: cobalamin-binding protein [Candidatus Cloacimonas sp.]|jgi:iron complex transport system substrate-binding protein|nr:cobalamin-binding protein [Candidatus Cloacimonas sp.]